MMRRVLITATGALLSLGCGGDVPATRPAPPLTEAGSGMPRLERRPLALAQEDLPDGRFTMFALSGDGRIVYVQNHSEPPLLRVIDTTGHRVGAFGREGEGPGEWRLPIFIGVVGDTLRSLDTGRGKLVEVRLDGTLVRERQVLVGDIPLAWHADSVDHWQPPLPPYQDTKPTIIRSVIGEFAGRTLLTADDSVFAAAIMTRGDNAALSFPYAATADRIWVGDPRDYRIRAYDPEGRTLFTLTPDVPPAERGPLTLARVREGLENRPKYSPGPNGEAIRVPDAAARLDTLERERIPHFGRASLQVDQHGRLWVFGRTHDSTSIDLFRDSTYIGRTLLPCMLTGAGVIVSIAADWLALECDVQAGDWPTELQLYRVVEQ